MPVGGHPPLLFHIMPPPATPQPEPRTGAAPGDRHGFVRVQSFGPEETFTLFVRYCGAFSVGSPGMMEILGCLTLGWEKSMHAPLSGLCLFSLLGCSQ